MKNTENPKFGFNRPANRIVFLNQAAFDTMLQAANDLEDEKEPQPFGKIEYDDEFEKFYEEKYNEPANQNNVKKMFIEELVQCNEIHEKLKENNEGVNVLIVTEAGSLCPECDIGVLQTKKLSDKQKIHPNLDIEGGIDPEAAKAFARLQLNDHTEVEGWGTSQKVELHPKHP